jgi:soluble lytic murein transglycosylase-like protein
LRKITALLAAAGLALAIPGRLWAMDRAAYEATRLDTKHVALPPAAQMGGTLAGQVVELRGEVTGLLIAGDQVSFLLNYDGTSFVVKATAAERNLQTSSRVRLLARAPANLGGMLELVALTWDFDDPPSSSIQNRPLPPTPPAAVTSAAAPTVRGYDLASRSAEIITAYQRAVQYFNPRLSSAESNAIARAVLAFSVHYGLDPRLVVAVIAAESRFNPAATSPKGAMGLGQLMPGTAAGLGVRNPYDIYENLAGSIRLIRGHLDQHAGSPQQLALALASYNAGSGAVRKYGGVPPYRETQEYVAKVEALYLSLLTPEERKALQPAGARAAGGR